MVKFFAIESFTRDIEKYLKKEEYAHCKEDLCNFFLDKDIQTIFSQPILISPAKGFNFIKSRIENSCFNKGKSSGYRLYYYVDVDKKHVYLIGYYPKTGKYGREDLSELELKILIRAFGNEKKSGVLVQYDIHNGFNPLK